MAHRPNGPTDPGLTFGLGEPNKQPNLIREGGREIALQHVQSAQAQWLGSCAQWLIDSDSGLLPTSMTRHSVGLSPNCSAAIWKEEGQKRRG